jgi:hypothetical protein
MHIELTENEKNELAKDCGYSNERYTDKVKEGVKHSEYDKDEENAIHRKTLKIVIDKLVRGEPLTLGDVSEFLQYYGDIERIKAEVKTELDIGKN